MTPRNKHQQALYLEPEAAELLDRLTAISRIPKAVLLREAVDDLLSRNRMGDINRRTMLVRAAFKAARKELSVRLRDLEVRRQGIIPIRACTAAIEAIDAAREEFGD